MTEAPTIPPSGLAAAIAANAPPAAAPAAPAVAAPAAAPAAPAAAPAWLSGLPEDLRGSEHLARYQSIEDLAKGHIATATWARGRVPIPKGDDPKAREDFIALARPTAATDYQIDLPEGSDTSRADGFKEKAYQLGLMDWQVKELAQFDAAYMTDVTSRMEQAAQDELMTRQVNLGPAGYARTLEAIGTMVATSGGDAEQALEGLQRAFGAGAAFDLLAHFAKATGELDKVDAHDVAMRIGAATPGSAQSEIDRLSGDKAFMDKVRVAGSPEAKRWSQLNATAAGV